MGYKNILVKKNYIKLIQYVVQMDGKYEFLETQS